MQKKNMEDDFSRFQMVIKYDHRRKGVLALIEINDDSFDDRNLRILKVYLDWFANDKVKISVFTLGLPKDINKKMNEFLMELRSKINERPNEEEEKKEKKFYGGCDGHENIARRSDVRDFLQKLFVDQLDSELSHIPDDTNQRRLFYEGIFTNFYSKNKNLQVVEYCLFNKGDRKRKAKNQLDEIRENKKRIRVSEMEDNSSTHSTSSHRTNNSQIGDTRTTNSSSSSSSSSSHPQLKLTESENNFLIEDLWQVPMSPPFGDEIDFDMNPYPTGDSCFNGDYMDDDDNNNPLSSSSSSSFSLL